AGRGALVGLHVVVRPRGRAVSAVKGAPDGTTRGRSGALGLPRLALGAGGEVDLVQPTLLAAVAFPPPATVALVLSRQDRAGARLAPDAHEAAVVQRVVGHLERPDRVPDVGAGAGRQRVPLEHGATVEAEVGLVDLDHREPRAAARALIAALARDPAAHTRELAAQRRDLADPTALLVPVLQEREQPLFADQGLHRGGLGESCLHPDPVV